MKKVAEIKDAIEFIPFLPVDFNSDSAIKHTHLYDIEKKIHKYQYNSGLFVEVKESSEEDDDSGFD